LTNTAPVRLADRKKSLANLTDNSEQVPSVPTPRAAIAVRTIAALNRFVAWVNRKRTRRFVVYSIGSILTVTLIVGLRFGRDLPAARDDLLELISDLFSSTAAPETPPPAPVRPPAAPADPLANIPKDLITRLTQPSPETLVNFGRRFPLPPAKLCETFAAMGFSGAHLVENPLTPTEWTCDSDLVEVAPASGDGQQPSTVFLSMRGDRQDRISRIRLKLNLTDVASAETGKRRFVDFVKALHARFHWNLPADVEASIIDMRSASYQRFGLVYDIRREGSEPPRLNVVITPDDDTGIMGAKTFEGSIAIAKPQYQPSARFGPAKLPVQTSGSDPASGESAATPATGSFPAGSVIDDITH
jgi:hypothetical protein